MIAGLMTMAVSVLMLTVAWGLWLAGYREWPFWSMVVLGVFGLFVSGLQIRFRHES